MRQWGWPTLKILLALVILVGVGGQFVRDLRLLDQQAKARQVPEDTREAPSGPLQVSARLVLALTGSAVLYLVFLGCSAAFWLRLLRTFGEKPTLLRVLRAYFVGQLGKYVPGKALALFLRGGLVRGPTVRFGSAIVSAVYEVLTTMAAGAMLAAIVFAIDPPAVKNLPWHPVYTGLLLLGLLGIPLLPSVFNVLMTRMVKRIPGIDAKQIPHMRARTLVEGLLITGFGWALLGASVWLALAGVLPSVPDLTPGLWCRLSAAIGLSYVAGFLAIVVPGGVGVREIFLLQLLLFVGEEPMVALAVLLMRLAWTVTELVTAAGFQLAIHFKPRGNGTPNSAGR